MPRFFVNPAVIGKTHISLDAETLSHIRVLRLGPEEPFVVCDGAGLDYRCILTESKAQIIAVEPNLAEPSLECTVYLALTKGDRLEYAVQKSVELGAFAFRLFPAQRSVVRYEEQGLEKRRLRLSRIAQEAAKQSGRGRIPVVEMVPDSHQALQAAANADLPLFFHEKEGQQNLYQVADQNPNAKTASFVIGPEGGFSEEEAANARARGLCTVSLGKRILRSETAPVAALAAILLVHREKRSDL